MTRSRPCTSRWRAIAGAALIFSFAPPLGAVVVPEEGQCPPYPIPEGAGETRGEDVIPRAFRAGEVIPMGGLSRLANYLPPEVWERRNIFFYEGMVLQIGTCHRRYSAPPFFEKATLQNSGEVSVDAQGNLVGYSGRGLPFPWQEISDADPAAGWKWAWNNRYRYQGAGFRGAFRILLVSRRGAKIEPYEGSLYLLPMHGTAGSADRDERKRFWSGGRFRSPPVARGVAWRQLRMEEADRVSDRSDEIFVWLPEERRVRRAPPMSVDGIFLPSYTRVQTTGAGKLTLPDGTQTPDASIAATEHTRRGFTGLLTRPNAYRFTLVRAQDVLAPINSTGIGYPSNKDRSYGPSGLSLASDRWEIRRAVVLEGVRKQIDGKVASMTLYVDALTQQPLYMITRRSNGHILEVGILMGRFSGDDAVHPEWAGSGKEFGVILPVAATFFVSGDGGGWLRESFELRSDPPSDDERRDFTSTIRLQRGR